MSTAAGSVVMAYQGVGKRLVAVIIDTVIMGVAGWIIALLTGGTTEAGFELTGLPALLLFIVAFAYLVLTEAYLGGTLGKLVLGMRVIKEDGSPCDLQAALIRNLLRIVDGLFFYIVGAILVWTSSKRQRLGDRVAHTLVVSK